MDDHMRALIELRDKVTAGGKLIQPWHFQDVFNDARYRNCYCSGEAFEAYHSSSLDAAKAVHDIVLPDHGWSIEREPSHDSPICIIYDNDDVIGIGMNPSPARAWLLAILAALTDQEGAANG